MKILLTQHLINQKVIGASSSSHFFRFSSNHHDSVAALSAYDSHPWFVWQLEFMAFVTLIPGPGYKLHMTQMSMPHTVNPMLLMVLTFFL